MEEKQIEYPRRRRVPRRDFIRPIGLLVQGRYYITRSLQIGEGGIKVEFHRPLQDQAEVVVTFQMPDSGPTVVRAVVRNQEPAPDELGLTHFGLEFCSLEFQVKRAIRNYVALTAA